MQDEEVHVCHTEFALGVYLLRSRCGYTLKELATCWKISRQTAIRIVIKPGKN